MGGSRIVAEDSTTPPKRPITVLGKLPLATLAAGALNILGGATIGRAWITDLGATYYDSLMGQFDVPVGIVMVDNTHLLMQGYEIARGSASIYATIILLFFPFIFMTGFATVGGWVSWRRLNGQPDPKWSSRNRGPIDRFMLVLTPACGVFVLGWAMWSMIFSLPEHARDAGTSAASSIRQEMMQGCRLCRSFGPNKIVGRPIIADARGLYVAMPGGGIAVIPITGAIFNPGLARSEPVQGSGKRQ